MNFLKEAYGEELFYELTSNYDEELIKNIDEENFLKIINYLNEENIQNIDEILQRYLNLFLYDYEEFKIRFNNLKNKYPDINYLLKNDISFMEEIYD